MYLPSTDPHASRLIAAAARVSTVDTHQHLGAEAPVHTDLCRLLVDDNYLLTDLVSAGFTQGIRERVADPEIPLARRWALLRPFWEQVRHGSYAWAHRITLCDLYGATDLNDAELEQVSARLAADMAAPGLFERLLAGRCGIDTVLTQGGYFDHPRPRFRNVARPLDRADFSPGGAFEQDALALGIAVRTAEDVVAAMDAILRDHHARGAVGFKIVALPWGEATPGQVREAFSLRERQGESAAGGRVLLRLYVSRVATLARELGIPVAVHTGAPWTNWLDFRVWEPTALIPLLAAYPETHFDLYHAGIPHVTPFSMLGKAFPNVWLNLTWAHIISSDLAMRAIAEWLDLAPANKVLAFGGDYGNRTVVLTYGHLALARRHVAQVLAYRVKEGRMGEDEAQALLQAWFSDNPRRLYRLQREDRAQEPGA